MRARALLLVLTVALAAACGSSAEPGRHYEEAGGFLLVPPPAWDVRELPGFKYKFFVGPSKRDFAPNINTVDEAFDGTLDAYVQANMRTMTSVFKTFAEVSRADVKLDSGERAVKVVATNVHEGTKLLQTFYIIGGGDRKYVVTCTQRADDEHDLAALFEASVLTFRIE